MPKSKAEEKNKQPTDRNAYILKEISKELVHLENMLSRVNGLSSRYVYRSYIKRIILRIGYVQVALKDLRERVKFDDIVAEMHEEERHANRGESPKG